MPSISLLSDTIDRRRLAERRALLDPTLLDPSGEEEEEDEEEEAGDITAAAEVGKAVLVGAPVVTTAPVFTDALEDESAIANADTVPEGEGAAAVAFLRPPKRENMAKHVKSQDDFTQILPWEEILDLVGNQ